MGPLNEHQSNKNKTEANVQPDDNTIKIDKILQNFDILSSKIEKHLFRYNYLYLIGFFLLDTALTIPYELDYVGVSLKTIADETSVEVFFIVGVGLILGTFNDWQMHVPTVLREIFEKNRIYTSTADINSQYLDFLEHYHDALRKRRRYLLSAFLISLVILYYLYFLLRFFFDNVLLIADAILVGIGLFIFMYCLGITLWSLFISGQYLKKLSRTFEFKIEPTHPDNCGGLSVIGNFCFGLASPIFIGSTFFIGWALVVPHYVFIDVTTVLVILFIVLLIVLPIGISTSFRALWSIHKKMLSVRKTDEEHYVARVAPLREKIQGLLDANQLVEAKTMKEQKDLQEALYIPYPTWPFNIRTRIFTTLIGAGGTLLAGVLTALAQPFTQAILHLFKLGQ
jgi:hypothetical protein